MESIGTYYTSSPAMEMPPGGPSHLVTTKNIAARFAYKFPVGHVGTEGPIYVDELDSFVPKNQVPDMAKCFDPSKEHVETFKATMTRLAQNMAKRKAFKNLGIDLRNPATCNLSFVFEVATAAVEQRDGTGNLRACKQFARKCTKSANRRDTALGAIMSMIPSDIYGSIISGGVMTILAVAQEYEERRQAIENALADIPKKLDRVERLSEIHSDSKSLHEKADGVLVAIFVVLEAIVDEVTTETAGLSKLRHLSWRSLKNFTIFPPENQVTVALSSLDTSLEEFQTEVDIRAAHRMGRVSEGVEHMGKDIAHVGKTMEANHTEVIERLSNVATKEDLVASEARVRTEFQRFYAGNDKFDERNGGVREIADLGRQGGLSSKNKEIADSWFKLIGDFDTCSEKHVKECIRAGLGQLTLDDREKSQWIVSSVEVRDWLRFDQSSILNIKAEDAPQGLFHPLSFTAAVLVQSLQKSTEYPILSFFCGLRTNDSFDDDLCGSMAVLKCLNGQLLRFCLQRRSDVNISLLAKQNKRLIQKSTRKPKYAVALFRGLLGLLEEGDVVFVILDSWSRLLGDRSKADKIINMLSRTMETTPGRVIKVLVLDALHSDVVSEKAHWNLHVPTKIDGGRNDVQLSQLEERSLKMMEELKETRRKKREALVESDSDASDSAW